MNYTEPQFVSHLFKGNEREKLLIKILIALVASNLVLGVVTGLFYLGSTTVIMEKDGDLLSFKGEKKNAPITKNEIKKVAEKFIKKRFEWEKFNLDEKLDTLSSIVTSGLKARIREDLIKESSSYSSISQYVGKVNFTVGENGDVVVSFDKILRLTAKPANANEAVASIPEKIPLLSETQVQLIIVKGTSTDENPLGLYVNSVTEYAAH
jgi:hypothetical protein